MAILGPRPDNRRCVPFLFVRNGIFAQIRIGDSVIQLGDKTSMPGEKNPASPQTLGGASVVLEPGCEPC